MNRTSRLSELAIVLWIGSLFVIVAASVSRGQDKKESASSLKVFPIPEQTLLAKEKELLLRRRDSGWQVSRIERFVWQESLVGWNSNGIRVGFIRHTDVVDAPVANTGLFVVLKVAQQIFATERQAIETQTNEDLLKALDQSDEVLVKAVDLKPPNFSITK